jgi:hypothetical protein
MSKENKIAIVINPIYLLQGVLIHIRGGFFSGAYKHYKTYVKAYNYNCTSYTVGMRICLKKK